MVDESGQVPPIQSIFVPELQEESGLLIGGLVKHNKHPIIAQVLDLAQIAQCQLKSGSGLLIFEPAVLFVVLLDDELVQGQCQLV